MKNVKFYVGWISDDYTINGPFEKINNDNIINTDSIIFLAAGQYLNELTAVLQAALNTFQISSKYSTNQTILQAIDQSPIKSKKLAYVYAYFKNGNPKWNNCFYIGKGIGDRYLEHVTERIRSKSRNATTEKERLIDNWINDNKFLTNQVSESEIIKAAKSKLVKILLTWDNEFSDQCAFAAEHILIHNIYGVYNLTNLTKGNKKNRVLSIVRNYGLNLKSKNHLISWKNTIEKFFDDPQQEFIYNRSLPELHLLSNEKFFQETKVDERMDSIGLEPVKNRTGYSTVSENIHLPEHYGISGAADPCLTYIPKDKSAPFRVQLKLSIKEPTVIINIKSRKNDKRSKEEFKTYINNRFSAFYNNDVPIRKRNDPYFKPFRILGNNKDDNYKFPIDKDANKIVVSCPWLNKGKDTFLSLDDALSSFINNDSKLSKPNNHTM